MLYSEIKFSSQWKQSLLCDTAVSTASGHKGIVHGSYISVQNHRQATCHIFTCIAYTDSQCLSTMLGVGFKLIFLQAQLHDNAQHASFICIQNSSGIKQIFLALCILSEIVPCFPFVERVECCCKQLLAQVFPEALASYFSKG